ncbi:hypothetical protein KEJ27_10320, partial [Candidatus Bathyarchaeota archaeon]|nr:hypothetical protein [Candidatus Bathyarchaeota archaeon]
LHIWNTSGVTSIIAKFTYGLFDTKSHVVSYNDCNRPPAITPTTVPKSLHKRSLDAPGKKVTMG